MRKTKKLAIKLLSAVLVFCMTVAYSVSGLTVSAEELNKFSKKPSVASSSITRIDASIDTGKEAFFDKSVVTELPDSVSEYEELSVIVQTSAENIYDAYENRGGDMTLTEYAASFDAKKVASKVAKENDKIVKILKSSGIKYELGESYDVLLSGFEVTIKASDFEALGELLGEHVEKLIVGDVYEKAESQVITNDVDVYETGIFDSSNSDYQGDGVVVAVLDTGLDYSHSAFSVNNFAADPSDDAFTLASISGKISQTSAASSTKGLTAEDVYVSRKVPFAYDYADKDPDVSPINSEHGTHVAGIIAGKDDTITGVAPNAQLAIMKVFSDTKDGAKSSWILAGLEDCVVLGVDVINMSLGSSCGFTREVDNENINLIYDRIKDAGISLIAAASNDYNATMGSEKNGNLGLTSNPDSGTVGSPATYEASLAVASVDGVKTSYLVNDGEIIYFKEASTSDADVKKDFVTDILATVGGVDSYDFEYVTIPGVGKSSDYIEDDYSGKIVLVKRGTTTFEDKVRIALNEKHASGIIIYNNVSGSISMSVGDNIGAVCSLTQDEGERLAAKKTGIIRIAQNQKAGPFMSDFSSWGPTSDLKIKPEITAHGGEILSAVPGQGYERLSGTSMAAPNQAGATALIRQYVKYSGVFDDVIYTDEGKTTYDNVKVTDVVNQLMMSNTDIVYNKNGLPYAIRKQGAGLVNITKSTTSAAYITTYDLEGNAMSKTKFELGDDKAKLGVYEMTFDIKNINNSSASYDISSIVMTEGVSETYTGHDEKTVTQDGYLLSGATTTVVSVSGGVQSGNAVTVAAKSTAKVKVKIALSNEDMAYLDKSFANGMYVEGFIHLEATAGTDVDMNIAFLGFYGDWTQAPIFDEEYYDTHKDEINKGLDENDKVMADAYATRVIGGLYSDYIVTLGSYYFTQDPSVTQIAADKNKIAISNQDDESSYTANKIRSISAGLLRNAKSVDITITDDSTGKEVWNHTEYNQRKSHSSGSTIYASSIDVDYSAIDNNLKNNTKYTVTVTAYIDYGDGGAATNERNTFVFPLYIDFEAPVITDVTYRKEYDSVSKKTSLYADLSVYDNHYAMGVQMGQIKKADPDSGYTFTIDSFGKYVTPVYSSYNSTSIVTVDLTDYVSAIKNSAGIKYNPDGSAEVLEHTNTFVATCYDYALNSATYELELPDDIISMYFNEDSVELKINETKDLSQFVTLYPENTWMQTLEFSSSNENVAKVVNQTLIAVSEGNAVITASKYDDNGVLQDLATLNVSVVAKGNYSDLGVNKFEITGYDTLWAYHGETSSEREIGVIGGSYSFGDKIELSMYPSERVKAIYKLDSYFPDKTEVKFAVGNSRIATVSEDGEITAKAKGTTSITATVYYNGKKTYNTARISLTVKDPFTITSIYLVSYKGLGGTVTIPGNRGITTIQSFAFSNYEFVDKDLSAGDVIDEEDPYYIKQWYIGDRDEEKIDRITKVIIPEGVKAIESYAFANLTSLTEVVLPSTLEKIGLGAFYGCTELSKINLENVKFINASAFANCKKLTEIKFDKVVAIGNYAFEDCVSVNDIKLPETAQSIGIGAFSGCTGLASLVFDAEWVKLGARAFENCTLLMEVNVNAAVISAYAFDGCSLLSDVTLGKDVSVIGEYAFRGTFVERFSIDRRNENLSFKDNNKSIIYKGNELLVVAPEYTGVGGKIVTDADSIATGAFAGNAAIREVEAANVKHISNYAFASCTNLKKVVINSAEEIGDYAFYGCSSLTETPNLANIKSIGNYAFMLTAITTVTIPNDAVIGDYAFANCYDQITNKMTITTVTVGENVTIGEAAFYCMTGGSVESTGSLALYNKYVYEVRNEAGALVKSYDYYRFDYEAAMLSNIATVVIGNGTTIGDYAFVGSGKLTSVTFGDGVKIGNYSFYNAISLIEADLSKVHEIGEYAFAGSMYRDIYVSTQNGQQTYSYALERKYVDGKEVATGYVYNVASPKFTSVDLGNVTTLGAGAFANNKNLTTVILGTAITELSEYVFGNTGLTNVNLSNIVKLGERSLYGTALTSVNVENITEIGAYALAATNLASVTLKDGAIIGEAAFYNCGLLATVANLEKATKIGAYAFYNTVITEADLTSATEVGDFAFGNTQVTSVKLGVNLNSMGENPFVNCEIASFGKTVDVTFNGSVIGTTVQNTYDLNETIKIINGVLYQVVPNGLELICYPTNKTDKNFVVEEGTVRISARAFINSLVESVTLPRTLKAIGDKAFYGCENLNTVTFLSYDAPVLEEQYDESYITYENLPITGELAGYEGLGITSFYTWNLTSRPTNFYFGANFVDYVGKVNKNVVMVKPSNGQNYDTFIFAQYFKTIVNGATAMTDQTLKVIEVIGALPADITLADEAAVAAARKAYDAIVGLDQKALVSNYNKLTNAESTINYLNRKNDTDSGDNAPVAPVQNDTVNVWLIVAIVVGAVLVGVAAAAFVLYKKNKLVFNFTAKETESVVEDASVEQENDGKSE